MTQTAEGPAPRRAGPTNDENTTDEQALGVESTARVPQYGSAEWERLPVTDPRKSLAVWIAAASWNAYWGTDAVAERLTQDLELVGDIVDHEVRRRVREMSYDLAAATDWRKVAEEPTHATLAARRAAVPDGPCGAKSCRGCSVCIRAAAVARQGGDYPGRVASRGAA